jgi:hypothetical protein
MLALIRLRDGNMNRNIANQNSISIKWKINKRFESFTEFTVKCGCLKIEGPSLVKLWSFRRLNAYCHN